MKQSMTIAAAVLGVALTVACSAQGFGGAQGGQGAPNQGPGAGQGRFMMGGPMMGGVPGGINPLQANPMGLLQRPEVQNTLGLDLRQKNAIAELQGNAAGAMQQRLRAVMQNMNPQEMRNMTPEQRRARMQEMQPQIQAAVQGWQGELDAKIKEILKPEQIKRLYELDKQRRGPLSMGDQKVAEELKLSPEHRQAIQQIVQEYQQQQGEVVRGAFEAMRQNSQQGQPPQFPDFTSRLSPLKQKLDKIRKASEEKVLNTLSPEEKQAWKTAQGEPFTFRADPPVQPGQFGPGRRQGFGPG